MKGALYLAFLCLLAVGVFFGFKRMAAEMGVAMSVAVVCLGFAHIDKLKSFKVGGVEAVTREAVQATRDAYATIQCVNKLASMLVKATLEVMGRSGRYGGMAATKQMEMRDEYLAMLEQMGVPKEQTQRAAEPFNLIYCCDHVRRVIEAAGKVCPDKDRNTLVRDARVLYDYNKGTVASPDEVRAFLNGRGLASEEIDDLLDAYRYFNEHHQFRDPDAWARQ